MRAALFGCAAALLRAGFGPPGGNSTAWYRYRRAGDAVHSDFGHAPDTGDVVADLITAHNRVRARAGLGSLQEDGELTRAAAKVVGSTVASPGCEIYHSSTASRMGGYQFGYVGENLYKVDGMDPTGYGIADAWYAERVDYRYGAVGETCTKKCYGRGRPCMTGHFTQMMWERSDAIGCAVGRCPTGEQVYVAVCQYGPGGNLVGERPFAAGAAANLGVGTEPCEDAGVLSSIKRSGHDNAWVWPLVGVGVITWLLLMLYLMITEKRKLPEPELAYD